MLLETVDAHRQDVDGITTLAGNDLSSYVATIINEDPAQVAAQTRAATNAVVQTYGEVAAVSGALFYETARPTPGFTADMVGPTMGDALAGELGWALLPLFTPEKFDDVSAETLSRLVGVTQKAVAGADRDTIAAASHADKTSRGVKRYASPNACAFCAYMTSSHAYGSKEVHWHNHCHCVTVPAWQDAPWPESEVQDRYDFATSDAIRYLEKLRAEHPDWALMSPRRFLKRHPELSLIKKNILRVMREQSGFTH